MRCHYLTRVAFTVTSLLWLMFHTTGAVAQAKKVGEKYGSREPAYCAEKTKPARGAPSAAQALQYLKCYTEKESGGMLYLLEDVKVQVAPKGRPYNPRAPISNVDTSHPIFDIRGSAVQYQCHQISTILKNAGKNCNAYEQPSAKGACWKTSFGDWECSMADLNSSTRTHGVPPPR